MKFRHWSLLVLLVLNVVAVSFFIPCFFTPDLTEGPSVNESQYQIHCKGIFKPGGYVDIEIKPIFKSVSGDVYGTITIYPDPIKSKWRDWAPIVFDFGEPPDFIADLGMAEIIIKETVDIPDEKLLLGKNVRFYIKCDLSFPLESQGNKYIPHPFLPMNPSVTIEISDTPLTLFEQIFTNKANRMSFFVLFAVVLIIDVIFFVYLRTELK